MNDSDRPYSAQVGSRPVRMTRAQKAKALVESGLAEDMRDAYAMLEDMGE